MAMIGYLGKDADNGILFTVSREVFLTPTGITLGGSARYATHERHNTHALTEFTGINPDSFSFDILLTAELGVNPLDEVVKIWGYERDGEALGLVIGGKAYGKYRWTITKHGVSVKHTDGKGNLYAVEVSVTLLEYLKGEDHNASGASQAKTTAAATASAASNVTAYTVKKGDCLWNIAKKFYGSGSSWQKIYNANKSVIGSNPNLIYPGQVFTIP